MPSVLERIAIINFLPSKNHVTSFNPSFCTSYKKCFGSQTEFCSAFLDISSCCDSPIPGYQLASRGRTWALDCFGSMQSIEGDMIELSLGIRQFSKHCWIVFVHRDLCSLPQTAAAFTHKFPQICVMGGGIFEHYVGAGGVRCVGVCILHQNVTFVWKSLMVGSSKCHFCVKIPDGRFIKNPKIPIQKNLTWDGDNL